MAEVYYKNGRPERAFEYLVSQLDPDLERREYPENPFSAVGTIVHHLMGVKPRASEGVIETAQQLPVAVEWAEIANLPVFGGQISVRHYGGRFYPRTSLTNAGTAPLRWRAVFRGEGPCLIGEPGSASPISLLTALRSTDRGGIESYVELTVAPGETLTVGSPNWCPE
jgi:hypothetical protein